MCLFAFHTDLSRVFQPCISCAAFSSPAFLRPAFCASFSSHFQPLAILFVPNFHVVHFQSPRFKSPKSNCTVRGADIVSFIVCCYYALGVIGSVLASDEITNCSNYLLFHR